VSALRATAGFPRRVPIDFWSVTINHQHYGNVCGNGRVIHFALYRRSALEIVRTTASDTSDQRDHYHGRDRQCGKPRSSSAFLRRVVGKTDPTIVPPSTV
jgi:hypothetical protein